MMKSITIMLILLVSNFFAYTQSNFNDVVYPIGNDEVISNCKIKEVTDKNLVTYEFNDKIFQKRAIAIKRDGEYFDFSAILENDNTERTIDDIQTEEDYTTFLDGSFSKEEFTEYQKYEDLYAKAVNRRTSGLMLTFGGASAAAISYLIIKDGTGTYLASTIFIAGVIGFTVGVPTMLTNSRRAKKYLSEMEKLEQRQKTDLTIGLTNNGLGLIIKF